MRRHTIVCLSSQPWHDLWTNKQHIMSRLGRTHRVIHVNFGPCNHPARLLGPSLTRTDGVTVAEFFAPGGLIQKLDPSHPIRIWAQFDLRARALGRYLASAHIDDAILWVYHPGYGAQIAALPHRLLVYDCVDEYTEFPEYRAHPAWLAARDEALCRRADVVFTTAQGLFEDKRRFNPDNTYLVHNVGDAAHFGHALDAGVTVPPDLARLPRPIIGFVGAVSSYKIDVELVVALARQRRDWSIVLIGPKNTGDRTSVAPLEREPNIHLLGRRDYASLPAYVKGFDVSLIPYRLNAYTARCFPIKFFELLASGKPLVITPLPALAGYFDAVRVAGDADALAAHCAEAMRDPQAGMPERLALAAQNDWQSRIDKLMAQVERRLDATAERVA